jgi:diadenosine tetraphosphatase ApaH/serine/threonine PP2A family protein phosphatase
VRIAVLSDVHSNLEALEAVLGHAVGRADAYYVLGDIVGYGADPQAVVDRLAALGGTLIAGNHDLAATGRFDTQWFNRVAAEAIRWTTGVLDAKALAVLRGLEPRADSDEGLLVHGSVLDPAAEYVVNTGDASESFGAEPFAVCFFGHTHLPVGFWTDGGPHVNRRGLVDARALQLEPDTRYMLNPGSVGQPRDGDQRASYMIFDGEARTATVHRVEYAIETAQRKIRDARLPEVLADRLAVGR